MVQPIVLRYKPVQHITVLNIVSNCNTMVSIIMLYYNIITLWDNRSLWVGHCPKRRYAAHDCTLHSDQKLAYSLLHFIHQTS